jgi:hypothetical protein
MSVAYAVFSSGTLMAGPADLNSMRVLLVEDSWYVGKALRRQLQTLGVEVAGPVATAAEAECLISERRPLIVVFFSVA